MPAKRKAPVKKKPEPSQARVRHKESRYTFGTFIEASKASGIPIEVLRKCNRDGAEGISRGYVNLKEFLTWYFRQDINEKQAIEGIKRRNLELDLEERELRVMKSKQELVDRDWITDNLLTHFSEILHRICEIPSRACTEANPEDPETAKIVLLNEVNEIRDSFRDKWRGKISIPDEPNELDLL